IARKIRPLEFHATRPDRRPPGEPTRRLHWENPKAASRQNDVDQRQFPHQAPAERAAGSPASNARNLAGRAPRISQLGKESQSKTPTSALPLILSKALIWSVPFTVPVLMLSGAKFGWLRTLKYSPRSWSFQRSVKLKYLESWTSQLEVFGSRRAFLGTLPNVPKIAGLLQLVAGGGHPVVTLVG